MRTRTAAVVVGVAALIGTLTGAFVLPDHESAAGGRPGDHGPGPGSAQPSATSSITAVPSTTGIVPGSSVSPRPDPSPPTPSRTAGGPATKENLLRTSDFTRMGLDVVAQASDDSRITVPSCPRQKQTTVTEIASSGAPLQRVWDGGSVRAYEEAVTLPTTDAAAAVVTRVLDLLESCHEMPPGHFVSGPTHSSQPGSDITASWVGIVAGELNVAGTAPDDPIKIAGGMAVVRNGVRVAVLDLNLCNSGGEQVPCTVGAGDPYQQLDTLTTAAALRLG